MIEYYINSKHGKINILDGKFINKNNIKGIILHIHGLGSHFQFIYNSLDEFECRDTFFNSYGYKSFAFEFNGHGKSEGKKCYITNFNDLIDNLYDVIIHIKSIYQNHHLYICSESMGCGIVCKYIMTNLDCKLIKGVILLSPLCSIDEHLIPDKFIIETLIIVSRYLPWIQLKLTNNKVSDTTSNLEYINAKKNCKYNFNDIHYLCTVRELFLFSLWINNNNNLINQIKIPFIIFHGLRDQITTPQGSINLFNQLKTNKKSLVLLPKSNHCLLVPLSPDDLTPYYIYYKILKWLQNQH
jgi:alpha-beta hydrolase superfamily lysophospholipase